MASHLAFRPNLKNLTLIRSIATSTVLSQQPQLSDDHHHPPPPPSPAASTPLPPNPAVGNPTFRLNSTSAAAASILPSAFLNQAPANRIAQLAQSLDAKGVLDVFADWAALQKWGEIKGLFETWVGILDKSTGKPNRADVNLWNSYLLASLMVGAGAGELLDLVVQMEEVGVVPNTGSFNLVLKAMYQVRETGAAEKLLERMLQSGKESLPDEESYELVISMLFLTKQIDAALKYIDLSLKSGYMLSMNAFNDCVRSCFNQGRLETLASIIERCKEMDQNKALSPSWNLCYHLAEVAMQEDDSKLAFYALEFMAKWMAQGETARPPVQLHVDEGLVVSALATACRTYSSTLLDASWAILRRSLHQQRVPSPDCYLAKISAHASMGNLQRAFATLNEFESAYAGSEKEVMEDLLSPFTSLYPLVIACSKKGFESLDLVYFQLENLSRNDPPYKSVTALNCVILGCANIWDLDRAYQTFEAINSSFGLTPDIHSYNALMCAFGKQKKTFEASRVFEHLMSLGVKPNAMSYMLLVDAHLINRDPKAALSTIDEMIKAGFVPSRETLKKIRRRCVRELDYDSNDKLESVARELNIRMNTENRRDMLFNLQYSTGNA